MAQPTRASDRWSDWLFDHRFEAPDMLTRFRERVVSSAELRPGAAVLDVGCGDGLVSFRAADEVAPGGRVVFLDKSRSLLDHCRARMAERNDAVTGEYVLGSAETAAPVPDASVDAVLCRSVLVYLERKELAFRNWARVLRPGGRLSLHEFVAQFGWTVRSDRYLTWDLAPLGELGERLDGAFKRLDKSIPTRYGFSERDLVLWAEAAGFRDVHLDFTIDVVPMPRMAWKDFLQWAPNPCAPTVAEAMVDEFTDAERSEVEWLMRPIVERGDGTMPESWAHLTAVRS